MKRLDSLILVSVIACLVALVSPFVGQTDPITARGMKQGDLYNLLNDIVYNGNNRCFNKVGMTTNTAQITIASGPIYAIDGVTYHGVATTTISFTAGTALTASQKCRFGVLAGTTGLYTTSQGRIVPSTVADASVPWPSNASSKTMIGSVLVETNSTGAFTPGTTDLGDASITVTLTNRTAKPLSLTTP